MTTAPMTHREDLDSKHSYNIGCGRDWDLPGRARILLGDIYAYSGPHTETIQPGRRDVCFYPHSEPRRCACHAQPIPT